MERDKKRAFKIVMGIRLHPKAEEDLGELLDYYYQIDPHLEMKFIDSLDLTFENILNFPNMYQHQTETSQKVFMNKFPYVVIYEQYENIIMILAIFHTSRNPLDLEDRI